MAMMLPSIITEKTRQSWFNQSSWKHDKHEWFQENLTAFACKIFCLKLKPVPIRLTEHNNNALNIEGLNFLCTANIYGFIYFLIYFLKFKGSKLYLGMCHTSRRKISVIHDIDDHYDKFVYASKNTYVVYLNQTFN